MPRAKRRLESTSSTSDSDSGSSSSRLSASMSSSNLAKERDRRKKKLIRLSSLSQLSDASSLSTKTATEERRSPMSSPALSNVPIAINPPKPKTAGLRRMIGQTQLSGLLNAHPKESVTTEKEVGGVEDLEPANNIINRLPIWKQKHAVDSPSRDDPFAFLPSPASSLSSSTTSFSLVRKQSKSSLPKTRSTGKLRQRGAQISASVETPASETKKPSISESDELVLPVPPSIRHDQECTPPQRPKMAPRANASPHPGAVRSSLRKKLAPSPLSSPCIFSTSSLEYRDTPQSTSTTSCANMMSVPSFGFGALGGRCSPVLLPPSSEQKRLEKDVRTPTRPSGSGTLRPTGKSYSDLRHTRKPVSVQPDSDCVPQSMERPLRVGLSAHQSLFNLRMTPERRRSAERELVAPPTGKQATPTKERAPSRAAGSSSTSCFDDAPTPLPVRCSPRKGASSPSLLRTSTTVSDLRSASKQMMANFVKEDHKEEKRKLLEGKKVVKEEGGECVMMREEKAHAKNLPLSEDCFVTPNQSFSDLCSINEESSRAAEELQERKKEKEEQTAITNDDVIGKDGKKDDESCSEKPLVSSVPPPSMTSSFCEAPPPFPPKKEHSGSSTDSENNEFFSLPPTPILVKKSVSTSSPSAALDSLHLSRASSDTVVKKEEEMENVSKPPPPVPLRSILKRRDDASPRQSASSRIQFTAVDVFYFGRQQGGATVPQEGEIALAMVDQHFTTRRFPLLKGSYHRLNLTLTTSEDELSDGEVGADEHHLHAGGGGCTTMEMERIRDKKRATMLKKESVQLWKPSYNDRLEWIRESRRNCGCSCRDGICRPETCECQRNGMQCQVDGPLSDESPHITFPCPCSASSCNNTEGRIEFDRDAVFVHHSTTMQRLRDMERAGIYSSPRVTRFDDELLELKEKVAADGNAEDAHQLANKPVKDVPSLPVMTSSLTSCSVQPSSSVTGIGTTTKSAAVYSPRPLDLDQPASAASPLLSTSVQQKARSSKSWPLKVTCRRADSFGVPPGPTHCMIPPPSPFSPVKVKKAGPSPSRAPPTSSSASSSVESTCSSSSDCPYSSSVAMFPTAPSML